MDSNKANIHITQYLWASSDYTTDIFAWDINMVQVVCKWFADYFHIKWATQRQLPWYYDALFLIWAYDVTSIFQMASRYDHTIVYWHNKIRACIQKQWSCKFK